MHCSVFASSAIFVSQTEALWFPVPNILEHSTRRRPRFHTGGPRADKKALFRKTTTAAKREFTFFQSSSQLFEINYCVNCRRALLEMNSYQQYPRWRQGYVQKTHYTCKIVVSIIKPIAFLTSPLSLQKDPKKKVPRGGLGWLGRPGQLWRQDWLGWPRWPGCLGWLLREKLGGLQFFFGWNMGGLKMPKDDLAGGGSSSFF